MGKFDTRAEFAHFNFEIFLSIFLSKRKDDLEGTTNMAEQILHF